MKNLILLFSIICMTACSKNEPTLEIDQEELGTASLIFTPVEEILIDGQVEYRPDTDEEIQHIQFTGTQLLPTVGEHIDLEVGHTYQLDLKTTDFYGRESQESFLTRAATHQAFLLGLPADAITYTYADDQVGVKAYIKVLKSTDKLVAQYIMRHLNSGVKDKITAADWNNSNYTKFTGANDLQLKFELHLIENSHEH